MTHVFNEMDSSHSATEYIYTLNSCHIFGVVQNNATSHYTTMIYGVYYVD